MNPLFAKVVINQAAESLFRREREVENRAEVLKASGYFARLEFLVDRLNEPRGFFIEVFL